MYFIINNILWVMRLELLENIRKKKGFTQAELARMINFSTTGYQKMIDNGDIKASVLESICKILNVDILIFFDKETNKSYKVTDAETYLSEPKEVYQKADYQRELLTCYKTISELQKKLLVYSEEKKTAPAAKKTRK
jgi:transcriptional regulator with XRE-family HTH domain